MEKNTIVLDELGKEIGRTYPKRARGLVKNGRAEYVDDCTIRMWSAHAPTMIDDDIMEDNDMSKIISFNARDFRLDKDYQGNNSASRMYITDMFAENVEIYELPDNSQIYCDKTFEPDEDVAFRFALVGDYSDSREVLQFMVVPYAGEVITEEEWENRYVFSLAQCQYKPVLNKRWGNSSVRVYEIPFKAEGSGKVRLLFLEKNSVARIVPAKDNEAYAQFTEYTMSGWINEKKEQFGKLKDMEININVDKTMKDLGETLKNTADKVKAAAQNFTMHSYTSQNTNGMHCTENIDGNQLAIILNGVSDGCNVDFSNSTIVDVENIIDCGGKADGGNFSASNSSIDGKAFCGILQKVGDGCNVDFTNANIGEVNGEITQLDGASDGCNFNVINTEMSEAAFGYLMSIVGDGCQVKLINVDVCEDESDVDFGTPFDGVRLELANATIPEKSRAKLRTKIGDGCRVSGL